MQRGTCSLSLDAQMADTLVECWKEGDKMLTILSLVVAVVVGGCMAAVKKEVAVRAAIRTTGFSLANQCA